MPRGWPGGSSRCAQRRAMSQMIPQAGAGRIPESDSRSPRILARATVPPAPAQGADRAAAAAAGGRLRQRTQWGMPLWHRDNAMMIAATGSGAFWESAGSLDSTAVLVSTILRQEARDYNEATDFRRLSTEPARSRLLGFSPAIVAPSCARTKSDLSFARDSQHAEA